MSQDPISAATQVPETSPEPEIETNTDIKVLPVPVALSTVQTDQEFSFQKYSSLRQEREFYLGPHSNQEELESKISQYYALDELIGFLKASSYKNITLQFPDALIKDSSIITRLLQVRIDELHLETPPRFWVLADTAYSACCVDEVAAEHVNSDLVVHFGDACLNAIQKLPVVYSLGRPHLDLTPIVESFKREFPDKSAKVCLMTNAPYTLHMKPLFDRLTKVEGYSNLLYSQINTALAEGDSQILGVEHSMEAVGDDKLVFTLGNRRLYSLSSSIEESPIKDVATLQSDYSLFHITIPQDPHLLYLTTTFQSVTLFDIKDQTIVTGPFPSMMKRYKFMSVARTAGCIGILVNTLSLRNTKETINKLATLIKSVGKKHYLFVVGKPNVAKLANFETIDVWCILGCSQSGIIIDQMNEFYKPIVTPYELTMALQDEVTWTGKWITDFQVALDEIEKTLDSNGNEINEESGDLTMKNPTGESEAPEFDVVTGKYVSNSRPLRTLDHLELEGPSAFTTIKDANGNLIHKPRGGAVIKGTVSTSVSHLQSRHWQGLGSDFKDQDHYEDDGATVEMGISGVARGYQFDRSDANDKEREEGNK
ncbi:hypothetical protein NCAS_0A02720 [Naumovozyma castellii]|uniref:2-(3-amino-3-carboxypropyl)histidine synthase subunit 2 n=1 Tax=Naumovozyma castellii TaxID=27288 RepID=G0V5U2_NAUCA|nr:hypothetical protein NCAS_0A02720 [Naumovozyma castellii CBS 4309]CCC66830.1 hypothetical protein NCAS_0A02720 [Naumovozyma castellii CBS 4309]